MTSAVKQTMKMEVRMFKAIVFTSAETSLASLLGALPRKDVTYVHGSINDGCLGHGIYNSVDEFCDTEKHSIQSVTRQGEKVFQYLFYAGEWTQGSKRVFMVAAPFSKLADVLFSRFHTSNHDKRLEYLQLNLRDLTQALLIGRGVAAKFFCRSAGFRLDGDTTSGVEMSGNNVFSSDCFKETSKAFDKRLVPRRLRLEYRSGANRPFVFATDYQGNFWFQVATDGSRLDAVPQVFQDLSKLQGVVGQPSISLPKRGRRTTDEGE